MRARLPILSTYADRVSRYRLSEIPLIHGGERGKMRKHRNSISASMFAITLVPDLSRYFTLSLNRTPRNYIGFDSLITNDLGAIDPQLPRGINAITLVATARELFVR